MPRRYQSTDCSIIMSVKIAIIAAIAQNNVIGHNNQLPWHLPADLQWFKAQTLNKPIIMGRKTFESLGRALPKRHNIVITRQSNLAADNIVVCNSLDKAIAEARSYYLSLRERSQQQVAGEGLGYLSSPKNCNPSPYPLPQGEGLDSEYEIMIIGGAEIYKQALDLADTLYMTHVNVSPVGDTYFPNFVASNWAATVLQHVVATPDSLGYQIVRYNRLNL
jgi:dihydrofolate reductase